MLASSPAAQREVDVRLVDDQDAASRRRRPARAARPRATSVEDGLFGVGEERSSRARWRPDRRAAPSASDLRGTARARARRPGSPPACRRGRRRATGRPRARPRPGSPVENRQAVVRAVAGQHLVGRTPKRAAAVSRRRRLSGRGKGAAIRRRWPPAPPSTRGDGGRRSRWCSAWSRSAICSPGV